MQAMIADIEERITILEKEVADLDYTGCPHCGHLTEEQIDNFGEKGKIEALIREYKEVLKSLED